MTQDFGTQLTSAQLVAQARELATLPDIYTRIRKILDDPISSQADVADALATDPALAGRLLRMANSAFYGRPGKIATVSGAVGLLGTQQIHDLVLATAVIHAFDGFSSDLIDREAFWHSSLYAASVAKALAEHCNILDSERLFVGGLLAGVGQLILCQEMPMQMRAILGEVRDEAKDMATLQREQLGFDYAQLSAELFGAWQLPPELVIPISSHTQPAVAGESRLEAAVLHVALRMAAARAQGQGLNDLIPTLDDEAWKITELSFNELERIGHEAQALTEEIVPVLLHAA